MEKQMLTRLDTCSSKNAMAAGKLFPPRERVGRAVYIHALVLRLYPYLHLLTAVKL